jgi:hypothetical protein
MFRSYRVECLFYNYTLPLFLVGIPLALHLRLRAPLRSIVACHWWRGLS